MSWLKKLLGEGQRSSSSPRTLTSPRNLRRGDFLKFGFIAQEGISNQRFTVGNITTYDFGGETKKKTVFTLDGIDSTFTLAVVNQGHQELLEIGKKILPEVVEKLFVIDKFAYLFEEESGVHNVLERISEPSEVSGWTAPIYRQEAGHQAYVIQEDYRHRMITGDLEGWEAFDYSLLVSDNRQFALQTEVYDGGRTEVFLLAYLAFDKIEELYPAAA